ncbi:hypothetical protein, partial [uncultured Allobaculum sp.]|uniref:hypothetical protein n=1 Tax=uncultured Allobaculum sp. TaxID=1187017 RepID=UPI00263A6C63
MKRISGVLFSLAMSFRQRARHAFTPVKCKGPPFRITESGQERRKEKRQTELVQALCVDYKIVCYFDLDTGKGYALRNSKQKEWKFR